MPFLVAVILGKLTAFVSTFFRLGSGATWPGEIALRLRRTILSDFIHSSKTVILIAGTNGKTTTSKMLETIVRTDRKRVTRNASGANLENGLISTYLSHTTITGSLTKDTFIFEVDEATLPHVLERGVPTVIILMNLFRDQLDRYGEVDAIAELWTESFISTLGDVCQKEKKPFPTIIINGDDPHLAYIGMQIQQTHPNAVQYFGLNNAELFLPTMQHATDSIFCPKCGNRLTFGGVYFSHLGKYACGQCGFTHPELSLSSKDVTSPLEGVYNIYNTLASSLTSKVLGISVEKAQEALQRFSPAFGRMETIHYKDKQLHILLSKNPTGYNESIRTYLASKKQGPLLMVVNDRIPDGTDISWIYDIDFELLTNGQQLIFVSGDRCYDLATRLQYAEISPERLVVQPELNRAIEQSLLKTAVSEQLWILPTYSAMLDVRKILIGRKIL